MKKLLGELFLLTMILSVTSCSNDYDPFADGNYRLHREKEKPMMKTIKISFGGDFITESEEPLLRAEDGDNYTAINVFRTEKNKEGATEEKYAFGLFKNRTVLNNANIENKGISIDVMTGYTYRFESTILVEKEDKICTYISGKDQYSQPFRYYTDDDKPEGQSSYRPDSLDRFIYTYKMRVNEKLVEDKDRPYFCELTSGTAWVDTNGDFSPRNANLSYPRVKRYYGTLPSFDPGLSDEVSINMLYKSFGLRFEIESLPGGNLTVEDITKEYGDEGRTKDLKDRLVFTKNLALTKEESRKYWDGLFSMKDLEDESETFYLQFTWNKDNIGNVTEKFIWPVTVKPNHKKILTLKITGSANYETKGNVTFVIEEEKLTEEFEEVNKSYN